MIAVKPNQIEKIDAYAERIGISVSTLMTRAGEAVANAASTLMQEKPDARILILCGGGNNGGDGFVCARYLLESGYNITVFCNAEKLSAETEENQKKYLALGGCVVKEFPSEPVSLLVDCFLGTGFKGELKESAAKIIERINEEKQKGAYVLSADIPSGINGDNGLGEVAVFADETLCIGEEKIGVRLFDGLDCVGKISTLDIGIKALETDKRAYLTLLEKEDVKKLLPKRKRNSHKGCYGKVGIVAGSVQYTGAAYLALRAALKSGVGYTALFTPKDIAEKYMLKEPESLIIPLNGGGMVEFNEDDFKKMLSYDAICYGMGLGISESVCQGLTYLLKNYQGKLIIDADGLNSLAKYSSVDILKEKKCDVLLTPHLKEFSRLSSLALDEIKSSPVVLAKEFSKKYDVNLLLKGASTIITNGEKAYLNVTGTSAQARGGSGDVLSGIIGGLCAQGLGLLDGACLGCYLVGVAAEFATEKFTEYAALPSDFIDCFELAFKKVLSIPENSNQYGGE